MDSCNLLSCIKDHQIASKWTRQLSLHFIVCYPGNLPILEYLFNNFVYHTDFLHNLLGYCYCYLNLKRRKARTTGPFYIEHIVSNPSSSPCSLKYFIVAQPLIRLASNINQFVAIIYLYNILCITRLENHFPIFQSNSIPYK